MQALWKTSWRARLFFPIFIGAIAILRNAGAERHTASDVWVDFERKYEVKFFPYEDGTRLRFENIVLLHSKNLLSLPNRLR
jgi:hypothetical protein